MLGVGIGIGVNRFRAGVKYPLTLDPIYWGDAFYSDTTTVDRVTETVNDVAGGALVMTQATEGNRATWYKRAGFYFLNTDQNYYNLNGVNLNGDFTICFSVKNLLDSLSYPIGFNDDVSGVFLEYTDDKWGVYGVGGSVFADNLDTDRWYKLTIKRKGSTIYLYTDGILINSGEVTPFTITDIKIGVRGNLFGYAKAYMDNFVVYNKALTDPQIKSLNDYFKRYDYDLEYYFEDRHISAQRDSKTLFCSDAGILSYSEDNGTSITRTLDISSDTTIVTFAHIFSNGNIIFCSQQKAFLSTDNLLTYSEISVKDHEGNAYTPGGDGVFRSIGYDTVNYNGVELLLWGCYDTTSGVQFDDINLWFTNDNGTTLKSVALFGTTINIAARHVHGVHFNPYDNCYYIQTGDGDPDGNNAAWIKATYNGVDDFSYNVLVADDALDGSYVKAIGFHWFDNYMYWGTDKTGSTQGVWRVPADDILNESKYEFIGYYSVLPSSLGFTGDGQEMISTTGGALKIITWTGEGDLFIEKRCTGGVDLNSSLGYLINLREKNSDGYYVVDQMENGDTYPDFTQGQSLMMRINKTLR